MVIHLTTKKCYDITSIKVKEQKEIHGQVKHTNLFIRTTISLSFFKYYSYFSDETLWVLPYRERKLYHVLYASGFANKICITDIR